MESLANIVKQFRLVNYWFLSVTENIKDDDGRRVVGDQTNSMEWIAGHLITGRYRNLVRLDVEIDPYKYLNQFVNQAIPPPNAIAFDRNTKYPPLSESREQWIQYADILMQHLNNLDEKTFRSEIPFTLPIGGNTIEDSELFAVMHETYHIGQMSIIRKLLGYNAMQLFLKK